MARKKKDELTSIPGGPPLGRRPIPTQEDLNRKQGALRDDVPAAAPLMRKSSKKTQPMRPQPVQPPIQQYAPEKKKKKKKEKKSRRQTSNSRTPMYSASGGRIDKPKRSKKKLFIFLFILLLLAAIIYVPGLFMKDKEEDTTSPLASDSSMIRISKQVTKEYPEEDFDGDGLNNAKEESLGTSRWSPDTDNDGLSDAAEVNITKTDPLKQNNSLVKIVNSNLKKSGKSYSSPFVINNVKLWASDEASRVYGAVAQTPTGFNFYHFNGYAQFPLNKYVYKVDENGAHTLLKYRKDADVWKIDGDIQVETYDEPLDMTVKLGFLNDVAKIYIKSNAFTKGLAKVLPDKGLITANLMAVADTEADTSNSTQVPIKNVKNKDEDNLRFLENQNTLSDLNYVYTQIDNGYCVAVSILNKDKGETIAICYGYDYKGNLLIANPEDLQPVGKLIIKEKAAVIYNKDGEVKVRTWFDFKGFGFDSEHNGERINFFNRESSESNFNKDNPDLEDLENQTEDKSTDKDTETTTKTEDSKSDTGAEDTFTNGDDSSGQGGSSVDFNSTKNLNDGTGSGSNTTESSGNSTSSGTSKSSNTKSNSGNSGSSK